eukprot:2068433-Amphidinium_carterae.1
MHVPRYAVDPMTLLKSTVQGAISPWAPGVCNDENVHGEEPEPVWLKHLQVIWDADRSFPA